MDTYEAPTSRTLNLPNIARSEQAAYAGWLQRAFEYRKISWAGGDPIAIKRKPDVPTFADAFETVIAIHREGWKDAGKRGGLLGWRIEGV